MVIAARDPEQVEQAVAEFEPGSAIGLQADLAEPSVAARRRRPPKHTSGASTDPWSAWAAHPGDGIGSR